MMMHRSTSRTLLIATIASVALLTAFDARAVLSVNEPWMRLTPDGRSADAFMKLRSSDPLTLVAADSFAARATTIRTGENRVAKSLALPANTLVDLKPEESRIRLTGLVRRIRIGEFVPLTLFLRDAQGIEQQLFVNAEVRQRSPTEDETSGHGHSHDGHSHAKPKAP
jgi:copper(I)-binding protein